MNNDSIIQKNELAYHDMPIVACCTPIGKGSLAIVRIDGHGAIDLVSRICSGSNYSSLLDVPSHTVQYGWARDAQGNPIDEVLYTIMRAPRTFTGNDCVEITCHNNQLIVDALIRLAITYGARTANPGEFARRAVMNGKIDILQAEAIHELIMAPNARALECSLQQLRGSLSDWMSIIEKKLLKMLGLCEVSFEFLEEDISFDVEIKQNLHDINTDIQHALGQFNVQKRIKEGIRIALIGAVNSGKSSLFNALLGTKRAIVSAHAGTTRDVIEAWSTSGEVPWMLVDTAGIRCTEYEIEKEGIERSFQQAQQADIIILVVDSARNMADDERIVYDSVLAKYQEKIILVYNKIDQPAAIKMDADGIPISVHTGVGLDRLREVIAARIALITQAAHTSPFMLNKRHYEHLLSIHARLQLLLPLLETTTIEYELLSYHIKDILTEWGHGMGRDINERCLDTIFRDFCIGK